jgi:multidrug resistance efflux pump
LCVLAGAVASTPAATDEPAPILTGTLRAAEAERFNAPLTSTWRMTLAWIRPEGDRVAPGEAVARFDPGSLRDNLLQAEDALEDKRLERVGQVTEGRLQALKLELAERRAETELEKARIDASIPEGVLEGKDYRERQLESMRKQAAYHTAQDERSAHEANHRANLAAIDIEIRQLEDDIRRYEEELASLELTATRSGIVVHETHWNGRKVRAGDTLHANAPVASVPDLDSLEALAWAAEPDVPHLAPSQPVELVLDAYPDRSFRGTIVAIGRAGEQRPLWGEAPYFRVRILIDGVDTAIMRPGMSVRCEPEPLRRTEAER